MRKLVLITSLVALFMYMGFASAQKGMSDSVSVVQGDVEMLDRALIAVDARLQRVRVMGWVPAREGEALRELQRRLGWSHGDVMAEERREANLQRRNGKSYAVIDWELTGSRMTAWPLKFVLAQNALRALGDAPYVTVQLEGVTDSSALGDLGERVLDALKVTGRQRWSEGASASVAGQTSLLPPGSSGVNVQIAVRSDRMAKTTRVWLGWPALQQEY